MKMKDTGADKVVKLQAQDSANNRLAGHIAALDGHLDQLAQLKKIIKERFKLLESEGYEPKAVKAAMKRRDETDESKQARFAFEETVGLYLAAVGADDET